MLLSPEDLEEPVLVTGRCLEYREVIKGICFMAADLLKIRCSHRIAPTLLLLLDHDNPDRSKTGSDEASLG